MTPPPLALGGALPHSKAEAFSAPGKRSLPGAQPWGRRSLPPHAPLQPETPLWTLPRTARPLWGVETPESGQPWANPCGAPRTKRRRPTLTHTHTPTLILTHTHYTPTHTLTLTSTHTLTFTRPPHSHCHRLNYPGQKTTFSSMVTQRVQETGRSQEGQFGRDTSGEGRWEMP